MGTCPDTIQRLVDRFDQQTGQIRSALIRVRFNPLVAGHGVDIHNCHERREQLQREIDATDRQIDALVYGLYGLTDAEIAIVEEATK